MTERTGDFDWRAQKGNFSVHRDQSLFRRLVLWLNAQTNMFVGARSFITRVYAYTILSVGSRSGILQPNKSPHSDVWGLSLMTGRIIKTIVSVGVKSDILQSIWARQTELYRRTKLILQSIATSLNSDVWFSYWTLRIIWLSGTKRSFFSPLCLIPDILVQWLDQNRTMAPLSYTRSCHQK